MPAGPTKGPTCQTWFTIWLMLSGRCRTLVAADDANGDGSSGGHRGTRTPSRSRRPGPLAVAAGDGSDGTQRQLLSECPSNCYSKTCDEWIDIDGSTCAESESIYDCDCTGCTCGACPSTCYDYDCDYWIERDGDTCETLESVYGCDCNSCGCAGSATFAPTPTDLSACYTLEMHDSYGDGWNGAVWTWREAGEDGQVLKTGTLATGTSGTVALCTFAGIACFEFEVDAGSEYASEISWAVNAPGDGGVLWEGGADDMATTTIATCTADPTSSPVPTATASPTNARVDVETDEELRDAAWWATSSVTIVLRANVTLTETLWFEFVTDVTLRSDPPDATFAENGTARVVETAGMAIAGNSTFRLIDVYQAELTLVDLVLTGGGGEYGGAVFVQEGTLRARRCHFVLNRASNAGGAVASQESTVIVEDSDFELNEAVTGSGGAISVYLHSQATIRRTTFANNKAGTSGGAVCFSLNRPSEVDPSRVEDCLFDTNVAALTGGGVEVNSASTTVAISTSLFRHNYAHQSGGAIAGSANAIISAADSVMVGNAAGESGGSAYATATSLTFTNVSVLDSTAGQRGGGVALTGDTSKGVFRGSTLDRCNASIAGGGLAAWGSVPELSIEGGTFARCSVKERGGALHVDGKGLLRVANTSFEDSAVDYETEPVCLTLTMIQTIGNGWVYGAELFVFRKEDYHGEAVYGCPQTCTTGTTTRSCDLKDYHWGTDPTTCDHSGDALTTTYGCDCSGCVCSGYNPSSRTYLYRFAPADGFTSTEQLCFERGHGRGEYVILVTDDQYPDNLQWTLEGYVVDGKAHDLRHLDFTTLESKEGCETPGGGAAYLTGGLRAEFFDTSFKRTSATNGNGGAVTVASEFDKMNVTDRSAVDFVRCTFEDFEADFYGQAAFSSISQLRLVDSHIAAEPGMALEAGTVFDFGTASDCQSGCGPGMYGTCVAIDNCFSCDIGTCTACPIRTYRSASGAVRKEQCLPCPIGTFNGAEGAAQCSTCNNGSFVTLLTTDADEGLGASLGGEACVTCPAGREATKSGSVLCHSCTAGASSSEGQPCVSCFAGTYAQASGSAQCYGCSAGKHAATIGSVECVTCSAGTFSTDGASSCTSCIAGSASSGGASSCTTCGEGSVSNLDRSLCSPCDPGTEADGDTCVECEAGLFNPEAGQPCRACAVGTKSSIEKALSCSPCPYSYTTTGEGSSECDGCIEGYYRDPTVTDETKCLRCPDNAYCAGDSIPGTTLLPVPLEGFWSNRSDLALVHYIRACPRGDEVCTGGLANVSDSAIDAQEVVARPECWLPENLTSDACTGGEVLCSTGALGPLCGSVEKGDFYWASLSRTLEECPEEQTSESWTTVALGAAAVVSGGAIYANKDALDGFMSRRVGKCYSIPAGVVRYTFANGRSKVMWSTFQILKSIPFTTDVTFPRVFNQFLRVIEFMQLDFLGMISASCVDERLAIYSNHVLATSLIPIAIAALIVLIWLGRLAWVGRGTPEKAAARREVTTQHTSALLLLSYLVLPSVSMTQFRGLNCVEFESKHAYLRVDTSVWCDEESDEYSTLLGTDIPLIILYQSIPFIWAALLFWQRRRLNPGYKNEQAGRRKRDRDARIAPLRFLFEDNRVDRWGYDVFDMWRRIIMVGIIPFAQLQYRPIIGCGLAAFSVVVVQESQPYHDAATNALAVASQWQLCVTYFIAFALMSGGLEATFELGVLLLVVNLTIVVTALFLGIKKNTERVLNEATIFKLRHALTMEKAIDKKKFDTAWGTLEQADPAAAVRVLAGAAELARRHTTKPVQGTHLKDVAALMAEAAEVEAAFHAANRKLVLEAGGEFHQGPLKKIARVVEKMENDYDNDHTRVVDVVRDTGVFETMDGYANAIEKLVTGGCGIEIVRFKDRLANGGNSFGYRDTMMNVKLAGGEHVGELQLHLKPIVDIKVTHHRLYAMLRAAGWEEDNLEEEEEKKEEEEEEEVGGAGGAADVEANAPAPVPAAAPKPAPKPATGGAGRLRLGAGSASAKVAPDRGAEAGDAAFEVVALRAQLDAVVKEKDAVIEEKDAEIERLKQLFSRTSADERGGSGGGNGGRGGRQPRNPPQKADESPGSRGGDDPRPRAKPVVLPVHSDALEALAAAKPGSNFAASTAAVSRRMVLEESQSGRRVAHIQSLGDGEGGH